MVTRLLLDSGADVNQVWDNHSVLHVAARSGDVRVVRFLLARRAHVDVVNVIGETALHYACKYPMWFENCRSNVQVV